MFKGIVVNIPVIFDQQEQLYLMTTTTGTSSIPRPIARWRTWSTLPNRNWRKRKPSSGCMTTAAAFTTITLRAALAPGPAVSAVRAVPSTSTTTAVILTTERLLTTRKATASATTITTITTSPSLSLTDWTVTPWETSSWRTSWTWVTQPNHRGEEILSPSQVGAQPWDSAGADPTWTCRTITGPQKMEDPRLYPLSAVASR